MIKSLKRAASLGSMAAILAAAPALAEPVTIEWQNINLTESQYEPVWKHMVADFEAAYPDIKIKPVLVARKDHWTKFVTAAQAGEAPCVVTTDIAPAAYNGYIQSLDALWNAEPEEFRNGWSEDIMRGVRFDGEVYGLPTYGGIYAEIYNRDLVEAAGLDASNPPETFAEYKTWAEALSGDDHWATAILGGPTDTTTRVLLSWIYANGGEPFDEDMTESRFAKDPKSLEAIKAYLGMEAAKLAAPGATTTNYLEQTNLFAQQKIATMRNAFWGIAKVVGDNPDLEGKLFVAMPPHGEGAAPATVARQGSVAISANCEHPEEAWEFIKFDAQAKYAIERALKANFMPLRNDLADAPEVAGDEMLSKFLTIGQSAIAYPPSHPYWEDISSGDIVEAVQAALLDPERTEEIFTALDEKLTEKLNDI